MTVAAQVTGTNSEGISANLWFEIVTT